MQFFFNNFLDPVNFSRKIKKNYQVFANFSVIRKFPTINPLITIIQTKKIALFQVIDPAMTDDVTHLNLWHRLVQLRDNYIILYEILYLDPKIREIQQKI